jgi:hypothetical protein
MVMIKESIIEKCKWFKDRIKFLSKEDQEKLSNKDEYYRLCFHGDKHFIIVDSTKEIINF